MNFNLNVASWDRYLRAAIGLVLVALPAAGFPWWTAVLGAVALATAAVGFCPVYRLVRISTLKGK